MTWALVLLGLAAIGSGKNDRDGEAFPYDGVTLENGLGIHDPAVCEFNGRYLCLNTNGNGFGQLRTSKDLIHWTSPQAVMESAPDWLLKAIPTHRSIWAPEAVKAGESLRMYYCASAQFGHNNSWIGYAECPKFDAERPTEGWIDRGLLLESKEGRDNFNAIDPSVLVDAQGRQWMFFGSYWSGIYVTELDPKTGALKGSDKKLVARNPRDPANGIEAPSAVYRQGYYYLFVNYGLAAQGVRSTYQIMVGRSRNPDGPFVDTREVAMTDGGHEVVLDSSPPMFGPGGGALFRDNAGRWLMSYHYYDARRFWGRQWGLPVLQIREVLWSNDGWPLPGLPISVATRLFEKKRFRSPVGHWTHQASFGQPQDIELLADGKIRGEREAGTWKQELDEIVLNWPQGRDRVQLAYGGSYYVGRNGAGGVIRGIRR